MALNKRPITTHYFTQKKLRQNLTLVAFIFEVVPALRLFLPPTLCVHQAVVIAVGVRGVRDEAGHRRTWSGRPSVVVARKNQKDDRSRQKSENYSRNKDEDVPTGDRHCQHSPHHPLLLLLLTLYRLNNVQYAPLRRLMPTQNISLYQCPTVTHNLEE